VEEISTIPNTMKCANAN